MVCQRLYYFGRVQGVGFRATTQALAAGHPVAGSVRNLSDGSVEVVVEGDEAAIEAFRASLENRLADYIERYNVVHDAPAGRSGFVIRY